MESKGLVGRVLSTTAAVTVSAVVISGVGGLVAAAPAFAAGATVGAPSPNKGGAGTSVKVTESHFAANSALTVSMNGVNATITAGGTTNGTGSATTTFTVPALTAGSYPVTVTDAAGNTASSSNFAVQAARCETLLYYSGTAPSPTAGTPMTVYYDDDSAMTSASYSVDGGQTFTSLSGTPSTVGNLTALDTCGGSVSKTTAHEMALTFTPSGSGPLVVNVTDSDNDTDSHTWSTVGSTPASPGAVAGALSAQLSNAGPFTTPTAVTDTATFTGTNGDAATGASISFYVCQVNGTCSKTQGAAEGTVSGATGTSQSFTPPAPAAGSSATWCFSAYYLPNSHYLAADDNGTSSDASQCFTISTAAAGSSGSSGSSNPPTPGGSGGGSTSTGGGSDPGSGGTAGSAQTAGVYRVGGTDRVHTAILTSQADYNDGTAGAVILARSDLFPDSLAAAPLAVKTTAPILLTPPTSLDPRTAAEISRVLLPGGTVYLLGQTAALSTGVENAVAQMGYTVDRIGGTDRFATAADIAGNIGSVTKVLLADGTNFPDAVSAAAACGPAGTVIALTAGTTMPQATTDFLSSHTGTPVVAVGGPAANAYPAATTKLVGADRYATSVMVAQAFFSNPTGAGMATGLDFPDALTAGPYLAAGWPMLLTDPQSIPSVVSQYLNSIKPGMSAGVVIFGGTAAVSDADMQQAKTILGVS